MANIDVISSCLVKMSTDGHKTAISRTLDLTPWDLQFLLRDPIQKGLLFYKPDQSEKLAKGLIDRLRNSLSNALAFFPPLSGRLGTITHDDDAISFFIDCNDAGAEFTYAVAVGVSVSDILDPKHIPSVVASFFPLNGSPNYEGVSNPLLGVQVNELTDGFFIGCTANHVIVDGTSFWHFFNSWAEISRGSTTISQTPFFDRWFPRNENRIIPLPPVNQNPSSDYAPPPLLERVFNFSKDSLAKLKAKANAEAGTTKISTLQALSAHLWGGVVRSRKLQSSVSNPIKQEIRGALLVGARGRIPLQDGYFGNAAYVAKVNISEEELVGNGLGFVALKINDLVSQQTGEATVKFYEDWMKSPVIPRKGYLNFVITSSPRFDVYGCDFGWGKPIAARSGKGQKIDGKMTLYSSAEDGIDVEVCLESSILQSMEEDAEFMEPVTV